ncbi:metalloproteinase inhibitor 4-like isoform X4 [Micropterus dolomieu]|uniref:metalloproteinase inhibitor 4-like isoform X3 n=1 Tax=Micropterus dolomieu TaxID=147949 RepID=UPI001E8CEC69|nr:metalloproteinase inhibitor 4-like isoform X3 [Micropterus dolomieu]XP_045932281.1 metalloproteinase inhibitor 4-like isoform X4 [Micropterus dolomieu]
MDHKRLQSVYRVVEQAVRVNMVISQERTACLGLWVLLLLGAGMEEVVEGCSCHPAHPQQLFCSAEIVIRAKISGEKIVSPSNSSSPYMKMIQYEIKMIKMFKGFDKAKDIQYVYTPVFSSLCGVKLDSNNKAGYLLSGSMWSDGRISIGQCDLVESWDNLSLSQKKNLNYRYQMGCECRINTCYTVPCASTGENECLWTDWLLDNSLNGEQARQYACIRRSDTTCSWYRGGPPPEKDFLDMTDP